MPREEEKDPKELFPRSALSANDVWKIAEFIVKTQMSNLSEDERLFVSFDALESDWYDHLMQNIIENKSDPVSSFKSSLKEAIEEEIEKGTFLSCEKGMATIGLRKALELIEKVI